MFFMTRANPKGSDIHKNISSCSETYDTIIGHKIGTKWSIRYSQFTNLTAANWDDTLAEKLEGFSGMLQQLWLYFSFPWRDIEVPVKHQFHGHNLLQRLLIREIRRLSEKMKDPIELELELDPLPIHSSFVGTQRAGTLGNTLHLLSQSK